MFHADKFKSILKSKKFVSQAESNPRPRVPEPKRSPFAIFNAACPFSGEFLVKVTFVSTRPGILRSRRILNDAKPSITAGGMKITTGSQKWRTNGALRCRRDYRQKNV
jgi:hypothetical protein